MTESEASIQDRLSKHRLLAEAPPDQIAWLAAHGRLIQFEPGAVVSQKGKPVLGLYILLSGHMTIFVNRGAGPQKVMEWRAGDVGGYLPYSRLVAAPGDVKVEVPTEIFMIPREEIPALIRDCYELTSIFVHVMLDRARHFTSSDLHQEKMSSLGQARGRSGARAEQPRFGSRPERPGTQGPAVGGRNGVSRAWRRSIVRRTAGRRRQSTRALPRRVRRHVRSLTRRTGGP